MNAFELSHVTKRYPSFTLNDINLTLPEGLIMGLVGENGAGKTTLIRSLLGMHEIDEGNVSILGCSDPRHDKAIMNRIGVVSDEITLPPQLTVNESARVMKPIFAYWDEAVFAELAKRLQVPLDKPFAALSRGNKMKAGILIALSHHPDLLILDEATSGLDPLAREDLLDLLLDFTRDEHHSILMSSHIISDLEKACDLITFVHEGHLLISEDKDALKERYGLVHCTNEALDAFEQDAVLGKRVTPYGADVIAMRDAIPEGFAVEPVTLEQLFLCMAKGGNLA